MHIWRDRKVSPVFFCLPMPNSIHFEAVSENNLDAFVAITRETLWYPIWPGAEAIVHEYRRWPPDYPQGAFLIFDGRELVGRVFAPQFEDYFIVRDLGMRAQAKLAERVSRALLLRAEQQHASVFRAVVFAPLWPAFEQLGFIEQKRRVTMRLDLPMAITTQDKMSVRNISRQDLEDVGELMHAAYRGTADDEGEDLNQWTNHTRDVFDDQYGRFLHAASFATPHGSPFHSATLVIENAPHSAVLAQVITRKPQTNRGYARRLILHSLSALSALHYQQCFLEATLSNRNAIHLYRSLGFTEIGPQIIYGIKTLFP
jgi:ribosomal protein S18 acetylase RimI-like enzyme